MEIVASQVTLHMAKEAGAINYGVDEQPQVIMFEDDRSVKSLNLSEVEAAEELNDEVESVGSKTSDGLSSASENYEILDKWLPEIRPTYEDCVNNPGLAKIAESID